MLSNGDAASIRMQTGSAGTTYVDLTEHLAEKVVTDQEGWAEFRCKAASVSVWVPAGKEASNGPA